MKLNLIFLGPPGAGKGTIASRLSREQNIPHISTGDLFRNAIKMQTPLGIQVQAIISRGELVPDSVTVAIVKERLSADDTNGGFVFDGFPRTIPQADALSAITRIDKVIDFSLSDEEVVRRLSGRRVCRGCGKNYHILFLPPKVEGRCDDCGGELFIRDDDKIESIRTRLSVYKAQTEPLIKYYSDLKLLTTIDASKTPEEVYAGLLKVLG